MVRDYVETDMVRDYQKQIDMVRDYVETDRHGKGLCRNRHGKGLYRNR
jgi:hypothetical protein